MSTGDDAVADASQIDLDALGADVNQHNFKTARASVEHHLEVALSRERGLDGETFFISNVALRCFKNLASRGDGGFSRDSWLERSTDGIRVEQRNLPQKSRIGAEGGFAGAVGTRDDCSSRLRHRGLEVA